MKIWTLSIARALACLSLVAATMTGCSFQVAGTETGNPDITACAAAAFDAVANDSAWMAESYVPGGRARLDPNSLYPLQCGLSKSLGLQAIDTVPAGDTSYVVREVVIIDTVLVPDTQFIDDTLTGNVYLVKDTVDTVIAGESMRIMSDRIVTDFIYVRDTFVTVDTVIYNDTLRDTLMIVPDTSRGWDGTYDTVAYGAPPSGITGTVLPDAMKLFTVRFTYDSGAYATFEVSDQTFNAAPVNYRLAPAGVCYAVSKQTADGVYEEYQDLDGNGLAKAAVTGISPRVRFIHRGGGVDASVDFDAGADAQFSTVADNRILGLTRSDVTGTRTVTTDFVSNAGSAEVRRMTASGSGSIAEDTVIYATTPVDSILSAIDVRRTFRSGSVARVSVTMTPQTTVTSTAPVAILDLAATVSETSGDTGHITDAVLDVVAGEIRGVYEVSGRTYRFTARRNGEVDVAEE